MKKTIAALAAAFALTIGGAAAAAVAAPSVDYTPTVSPSSPSTISPGASGTVTFTGWTADSTVVFTLTGEGVGAGNLAAAGVKAAVTSTSVTKPVSGGAASVVVTLPANATGNYTLLATGGQSGATVTTNIAATTAATGVDIPAWLIWGAVGAVGLGVIALIAVSAARRTRRVEVAPQH